MCSTKWFYDWWHVVYDFIISCDLYCYISLFAFYAIYFMNYIAYFSKCRTHFTFSIYRFIFHSQNTLFCILHLTLLWSCSNVQSGVLVLLLWFFGRTCFFFHFRFAYSLLQCLRVLDKEKIIHCDLKPVMYLFIFFSVAQLEYF